MRQATLRVATFIGVAVGCVSAAAASTMRSAELGGGGLVSPSGVVGRLRIDRSNAASVRAFAGIPDLDAVGSQGFPTLPTYEALGYDCALSRFPGSVDPTAARPSHLYCQTVYYVSEKTGKLVAFWTGSRDFHTAAGTRPGMSQDQASRLEHQRAVGQCNPAITRSTAIATLLLDHEGGRGTFSGGSDTTWMGGIVSELRLESRHNGIGLLMC